MAIRRWVRKSYKERINTEDHEEVIRIIRRRLEEGCVVLSLEKDRGINLWHIEAIRFEEDQ